MGPSRAGPADYTMTTQTIDPTSRRLALATIAVFVIALLGIVGWQLASRLGRPPDYQLSEVMPPAATAYEISRAVATNTANNPNLKQFRGGNFTLVANRASNQWTLHLNLANGNLIPPEQSAALIAASRLSIDAAFAKSLGVSDEQIAQLKTIPPGIRLIIADADRARIHKAWDAYIANQTPTMQSALEKVVQDVGQNSLEPTRKTLGERAQKAAAILTPQQIAPFKQ